MAKTKKLSQESGKLEVGITDLISVARAAGFSEISDPHKVALALKEGMPFVDNGKKEKSFYLQECFSWYCQNKLGLDELKLLKLQSEIAQKDAQTKKTDLERKITQGLYVLASEIGNKQAELISFLKAMDKAFVKNIKDPKIKKEIDSFLKKKWEDTASKFKGFKGLSDDSN